MYKKITFLLIFLIFSYVLFAQQSQVNTQFEGIWQGVSANDITTSFIFSGNNLIVVNEGDPISLRKIE